VPNSEVIATIASLITAAGVTMLLFRVQREDRMRRENQPTWLPAADALLLASTTASIGLVLVPLLMFESELLSRRLPTAGCVASVVALGGYMFALPAHYRIIFGTKRQGPRTNPEPAELTIIIGTAVLVAGLFVTSLITTG
jgi:hypothetical protein